MWRTPDSATEMIQTENAAYKLDGLILTIEGAGRNKTDGKPALQAFGVVSYDDAAGVYRMRAFNDGLWLESEVQLDEARKELRWGFSVGPYKTHSILRMNEDGDWTESHEIVIGSAPARKFMEITVKREQ